MTRRTVTSLVVLCLAVLNGCGGDNAPEVLHYNLSVSSTSPVAGSLVVVSAQLVNASGDPRSTPGRAVSWSKSGGPGVLSSLSVPTDANGTATVTVTTGIVAGEQFTVTASDNAGSFGTSPTVVSVAGPPTHYVFTANSTTGIAGSSVSITAQLTDANGNAAPSAARTVTWGKTGAGGSFSSSSTPTGSN